IQSVAEELNVNCYTVKNWMQRKRAGTAPHQSRRGITREVAIVYEAANICGFETVFTTLLRKQSFKVSIHKTASFMRKNSLSALSRPGSSAATPILDKLMLK